MTGPTPDLDAISARADAATPGPWETNSTTGVDDAGHYTVFGIKGVDEATSTFDGASAFAHTEGMNEADAHFIAHARGDIPALLDSLAAERDRADRAETALDQAPHDSMCAVDYMVACDCWKSEATA